MERTTYTDWEWYAFIRERRWGSSPCSCVISCALEQCGEILTPQAPDGNKTWMPDYQCYLRDHIFGSGIYSVTKKTWGSIRQPVGDRRVSVKMRTLSCFRHIHRVKSICWKRQWLDCNRILICWKLIDLHSTSSCTKNSTRTILGWTFWYNFLSTWLRPGATVCCNNSWSVLTIEHRAGTLQEVDFQDYLLFQSQARYCNSRCWLWHISLG